VVVKELVKRSICQLRDTFYKSTVAKETLTLTATFAVGEEKRLSSQSRLAVDEEDSSSGVMS
jgi:hypothetical protein